MTEPVIPDSLSHSPASLRYRAPATLGLLLGLGLGMLLLELAGGSTSQKVLETFGARGPGEGSWRLVASIFLHYGFMHLLANALALLVLGGAVESIAGSEFFLFCFFFAGVSGGFSSVVMNPDAISVGASGACFGLLAALLCLLWWAPERTPHLSAPQRSFQTFLLIFTAVWGCKPEMLSAHWADTAQHWGGLLGGFLACLALRRDGLRIRLNRPMAICLAVWLGLSALIS